MYMEIIFWFKVNHLYLEANKTTAVCCGVTAGYFSPFCSSLLTFLSKLTFSKNISGTLLECQAVLKNVLRQNTKPRTQHC